MGLVSDPVAFCSPYMIVVHTYVYCTMNYVGRKKVLFVTYFLLLVSNFASAFANSWQLYAAIRLVVGASIGGMFIYLLFHQ